MLQSQLGMELASERKTESDFWRMRTKLEKYEN